MRVPIVLTVLCSSFLCMSGVSNTSAAALPAGITSQPTAADVAKLKSLGLDMNDPDLKAKLTALGKNNAEKLRQRFGSLGPTTLIVLPAPHAADQGGVAATIAKLKARQPHKAPGCSQGVASDVPVILSIGVNNDNNVNDNLNGGPVPVTDVGEFDTLYIMSCPLKTALTSAPTVDASFGNCGTTSLKVIEYSNAIDSSWIVAQIPKFWVDERHKDGTLHIHTPAGTVAAKLRMVAALSEVDVNMGVGVFFDGHSVLGPSGRVYSFSNYLLGLVEGKNMNTFANGGSDNDRVSNWPGWFGGQGDEGNDRYGIGVKLEHGWKATAKVSNLLCTGYYDPDCSGVVAKVVHEPSADLLETTVHWSYPAGHGVAYTLNWHLSGPSGGVPLSDMKQSGCSTDPA